MQQDSRPRGARVRGFGLLLSVGLIAFALFRFWVQGTQQHAWAYLTAALLLAVFAQIGVNLPSTLGPVGRAAPAPRWRVAFGVLLFLSAAALWVHATYRFYIDWSDSFDATWLTWLGTAILMSIGLELAWGRWEPTPGRRRLAWAAVIALLLAVAAWYRLWNLHDFPGEAGASQVEDLQTGQWGWAFLTGHRGRWEYLSHAWVPAIGMWFYGPTMFGMRIGLATMSVLKVIPIFLWLRFSVGNAGALVGTALFTFSHWDVVLSRIPHPIQILPALVFCLLAGPARRGRPAAYVFLGLLCGFVLYEYVAYRPLVVLGPAGAIALSWRDRSVRWWRRLLRPTITLALIASMAVPLFLSRIHGRIREEYFNGWNRARVQAPYYDPNDTWRGTIQKRVERSQRVATLFFFEGDSSPVKNVQGFPLVDPFTACLLLLGVGFAVAHVFSPVTGLTLIGLLGTLAGTLVLTGNWDVGRAGGAVAYVFAICGFGAASFHEVLRRAWGRAGGILAGGLLVAAVAGAGFMNTRHLFRYWNSRDVQVAMRSNLGFLSSWLREHVAPNERAVGVSPGQFNVLMPNDTAFLRGREIDGLAGWDIASAVDYWLANPSPTVFYIFTGGTTKALQRYFEWLVPEMSLHFEPDPLKAGGDIAYGHFPAPPEQLARRWREASCRGASARFEVTHRNPAIPPYTVERILPVMDASTWPAELREYTFRPPQPLERIHLTLDARIHLDRGGTYGFALVTYAGQANLRIDDRQRRAGVERTAPVVLDAGDHTIRIEGSFEPLTQEPQLRVLWSPPDAREDAEAELLPFYLLAIPPPGCPAS